MVEVGEISVKGTFEDSGLESSLDRLDNKLGDMDNQFKQLSPSIEKTNGLVSTLGKGLIGIGLAGVAAITALATKSPVLAGTFAKMGVNMMKLSNTVGRLLKPIFESLANNLLPALNGLFQRNSESIGKVVEKITTLVDIVSDLINLNWTSLIDNMDKLFSPFDTPEEKKKLSNLAPFEETGASLLESFKIPTSFKEFLGDQKSALGNMNLGFAPETIVSNVLPNLIIDLFQKILEQTDKKEKTIISSDGVGR